MQQHKKIFSLFYLSIFSMLMLHQVLPHVHHEHEGFEDVITKVESEHHSHETGHHHHDEEEKNDDFDFLGFLFGNHAHSVDVTNLPTAKNVVIQKVASKKVLFEAIPEIQLPFSIEDKDRKSSFSHSPPDLVRSIYLSVSSLRGPPSLG